MSKDKTKAEDPTLKGLDSSAIIDYQREETTEDPNKKRYAFGLLPAARRYSIHIGKMAFNIFSGTDGVDADGNPIVNRRLGDVMELTDEEYEHHLKIIKRTYLKFNFRNAFEISPSKHSFDKPISKETKLGPKDYPFFQFCYLEEESKIVEKYGNGWRDSASTQIEPMVPWSEKMFEKFGQQWVFPKPPKPKKEEQDNGVYSVSNTDLKGNVLIDPS